MNWFDHFKADSSGLVFGTTSIGQATVKLLELNHPERIKERIEMLKGGFCP